MKNSENIGRIVLGTVQQAIYIYAFNKYQFNTYGIQQKQVNN